MNRESIVQFQTDSSGGRRAGFTLIELMLVVVIVGILASIAIPIMRGNQDKSKWSEGNAGAGTIATSLRAYSAEKRAKGTYPPSLSELGFRASDLQGTYFDIDCYEITFAQYTDGDDPELTFTITVTNKDLDPAQMVLRVDADGRMVWGEPVTGL